nr:hypothetical protein [Tanacetum cinerariifolium]
MPGPEHPPSPNYVPSPEYPEYLAPADEEMSVEDQPLPADASLAALSPGYEDSSEADDDDEEQEASEEDENEKEEEHLASANSNAATPSPPPRLPQIRSHFLRLIFKEHESDPTPPLYTSEARHSLYQHKDEAYNKEQKKDGAFIFLGLITHGGKIVTTFRRKLNTIVIHSSIIKGIY